MGQWRKRGVKAKSKKVDRDLKAHSMRVHQAGCTCGVQVRNNSITFKAGCKVSKRRSFRSGAIQVLKPGSYDLITPGFGKPAAGLPSKCYLCLEPVGDGQAWRTHDNGQYVLISHSACEAQRKV